MKKLDENLNPSQNNVEITESIDVPQTNHALGININYTNTGKAIQTVKNNSGETEVRVNQERFASPELAERSAVEEIGFLQKTREVLEKDPKAYLQARNKKGLLGALKLAGIGKIKMQSPQLANRIERVNPNFPSVKQEFYYACSQYLLTGSIPNNVSEAIQASLKSLKSKGGKNALDFIASGNFSLKRMADMYEKYIVPALEQAKKLSIEEGQTSGDEYRPQTGLEEGEAMDEGQIENKVEPFYGGYYRGRAYRYDPRQLQIVEDSTSKQTFSPEIGEDIENLKKYTFTGVFDPNRENILHLPYKALPLPESLNIQEDQQEAEGVIKSLKTRVFGGQKGKWQIMRDARGVFSLESPNIVSTKTPFSFEFVLHQAEDNRLNDNPVATDLEALGGNIDDETNTFLAETQLQSHLFPEQVAQKVVQFVRKKFKYPEDQNVMNEMNSLYAESGANIMQTICSHGIADCHWSNIFAGELIKRLGVAQRIPAGFYVQKDPRFDFAALAGTGHAWSEV
ncbi:transglutaminase domain-containing protein [bacterium]|jgi:hypothetical protein|nr:transglutaminase domain-containing protein [bacterium]MBT7038189.1 transglutaminase domain-containing protein [bacterium]MBT7431774.1 transglutaminase domain-containing protein [bacterium]